jgi:hypothetical protein
MGTLPKSTQKLLQQHHPAPGLKCADMQYSCQFTRHGGFYYALAMLFLSPGLQKKKKNLGTLNDPRAAHCKHKNVYGVKERKTAST